MMPTIFFPPNRVSTEYASTEELAEQQISKSPAKYLSREVKIEMNSKGLKKELALPHLVPQHLINGTQVETPASKAIDRMRLLDLTVKGKLKVGQKYLRGVDRTTASIARLSLEDLLSPK